RGRRLHAEGQVERLDRTRDVRIPANLLQVAAVEGLQKLQLLLLLTGGKAFVVEVLDHRVAQFPGLADRRRLVNRGEERAPVVAWSAMPARRSDGDERGQIRIDRSQPIGNPRPNGWTD